MSATEQCKPCKGTGQVHDPLMTCIYCGGTGQTRAIPSRESVKTLIRIREELRQIEDFLRGVGTSCCDWIALDVMATQARLHEAQDKISDEFALKES